MLQVVYLKRIIIIPYRIKCLNASKIKKKHNTKFISGSNYYGDFETSVLEI